MEQIKIIFFGLASFLGIEGGRIAADKTTVTVYPDDKKIEIIQEGLFTIVEKDNDSTLIQSQWNEILVHIEKNAAWAKELDSFPVKSIDLTPVDHMIQPHLILHYSKEEDLKALGIWYNDEKNTFSINHIPAYNMKTNEGTLEGNYRVFNAVSIFSFSIEPFLDIPENYKKLKIPLTEFLKSNNKE